MQKEINKQIVEKLNLFHSKWEWCSLSNNPKITWDIIKENLDKRWDWYNLSIHKNITWDIIEENPDNIYVGNMHVGNMHVGHYYKQDIVYRFATHTQAI
jgi:hypothetical protein